MIQHPRSVGAGDAIGVRLARRNAVRLARVPHARLDFRPHLAANGLCEPLVRFPRSRQQTKEVVTRRGDGVIRERIVVISIGSGAGLRFPAGQRRAALFYEMHLCTPPAFVLHGNRGKPLVSG